MYKRQSYDMAVFTADRHTDRAVLLLQRQFDKPRDWTESWKVALNATKSVVVLFSKRRKDPRRQRRIGRTYMRWSKGSEVPRSIRRPSSNLAYPRSDSSQLSVRSSVPTVSTPGDKEVGEMIISAYLLPIITYSTPI